MGRKADPKGKDRPRTIVLSGDVAEIAQKLAENNQLSSTLSDLLRQKFGFGSRIDDKKAELEEIFNQKQALTALEEAKIAEIEALEAELIDQLPKLESKLKLLRASEERIIATQNLDPHTRHMKAKALENVRQDIALIEKRLEEFQ